MNSTAFGPIWLEHSMAERWPQSGKISN
jgi:hypothetical protein